MLDPHGALICTMMLVSAADRDMAETELKIIGDIVGDLPVFRDFDRQRLRGVLEECSRLLGGDNGLDEALKSIRKALPAKLRETAYAIACDVAAADGEASQEELRVLELIRHRLEIEQLIAAGSNAAPGPASRRCKDAPHRRPLAGLDRAGGTPALRYASLP